MPYIIKPDEEGFRVCKRDEPTECFSKKPLSKTQAVKQMGAIILSEKDRVGGGASSAFVSQLKKVGLTPDLYLEIAKKVAEREDYAPFRLSLATDGIHKLTYDSPQGIRHFGRVGYGDYIIYCWLERNNEIPRGYADMKRRVFRTSHSAIDDAGKYSPNQLSINILW